MKTIYKKFKLLHILNILLFSVFIIILIIFHETVTIPNVLIIFTILIFLNILSEIYLSKCQEKKLSEKEKDINEKAQKQFQDSLKNIYDEHIFSITHELRSPLAVITSSIHNEYNNIKLIYNKISKDEQDNLEMLFANSKKILKNIKSQTEIIESFISSIAEYGSYMSKTGQKIINLHNYLLSIIINSKSYSRNMKVFCDNNIKFSDIGGHDFINVNCVVSPHDLSRMLVNIMTNSADAISYFYKRKKEIDKDYEPYIKISCIRPKNEKNVMKLSEEFLRINCDSTDDCQPFYLIIEDNGPGITDENIKKIFKYGFSTKKDDDSNHLGHHGLGLHLTLKLAALNDIKVYIRTNKNGTMFVLGFPLIIYDNVNQHLKESETLHKLYIINEYENSEHSSNLDIFNQLKRESPSKIEL